MFFNDYLSLVEKIKRKQLAKCTPLEYMIRNATPHLQKAAAEELHQYQVNLTRAIVLLTSFEWDMTGHCPVCECRQDNTHAVDCEMNNLLGIYKKKG